MMKVMLVGDPGEQRGQLKTVLAALTEPLLEIVEGEAATAANLAENASAPPDATLVMVNGNEEAALSFLQKQSLHSPRPTLLALLSARSAGLMKRALRSGADEILFLLQMGTVPHHASMETIKNIGEHLIPHFRNQAKAKEKELA